MLLLQTNTFQCILAVDGDVTFALYVYDTIVWTYGSASGGIPGQVNLLLYVTLTSYKKIDLKILILSNTVVNFSAWFVSLVPMCYMHQALSPAHSIDEQLQLVPNNV